MAEASLFPKTKEERIIGNVELIRKILKAERGKRWFVFKHDPKKQAKKVGEIDEALEALAELERDARGDVRES